MNIQTPCIVLIPAYMEGGRIADTVRAARALPGVSRVVVIDDGSTDDTAAQAEIAGAEVLRQRENRGKGAALRAGVQACPGDDDDILLLLDADLGVTAAEATQLLASVQAGEADLAIARFPKATGKAGFGLVKGLARAGTWLLTRNWLQAPISGQRACRRWVLAASPIADGYGVEVALNVAAGDAGARIVEVPVQMTHHASDRSLRGFRHRGRQFAHIARALLAALLGRTGEPFIGKINGWRACSWLAALALAHLWYTHRLAGQFAVTGLPSSALQAIPCGLAIALLLPGLWRARHRNFRSRSIPALGGLLLAPLLLVYTVPLVAGRAFAHETWIRAYLPAARLMPVLLGWLVLGLYDDFAGNANRKGFRGHLQALAHGQLTTGGMKLLGGGALALYMGWLLPHPGGQLVRWCTIGVAAVLIALSANAVNLFDMRPGRALKLYWAVIIPVMLVMTESSAASRAPMTAYMALVAAFILLATLIYAPLDFAGMMMLGDTGANPLGAFLGLCLALVLPLPGQVVAVAALIALHLFAERASITKTIERIRWLRRIDLLGRNE